METNLSEILRGLVAVAFVAGFLWTAVSAYRFYRAERIPARVVRMMRRYRVR